MMIVNGSYSNFDNPSLARLVDDESGLNKSILPLGGAFLPLVSSMASTQPRSPSVVVDFFVFLYQRGRAIGLSTVTAIYRSHIARDRLEMMLRVRRRLRPETLYSQREDDHTTPRTSKLMYNKLTIVLPVFALLSNSKEFASILPAIADTGIFHKEFRWDTLQVGACYGSDLAIVAAFGELAAGFIFDV